MSNKEVLYLMATLKMLVMEDNDAVSGLMLMVLEALGKVDHAKTREEALEYLATGSYDVIFADVNVPSSLKGFGVHGPEVLREALKRGVPRRIGLSGDSEPEGVEWNVDARYVMKPVLPSELLALARGQVY